ncbi:hypothetical protein TNCV_4230021, partial [Trichonephila clavipes]
MARKQVREEYGEILADRDSSY